MSHELVFVTPELIAQFVLTTVKSDDPEFANEIAVYHDRCKAGSPVGVCVELTEVLTLIVFHNRECARND